MVLLRSRLAEILFGLKYFSNTPFSKDASIPSLMVVTVLLFSIQTLLLCVVVVGRRSNSTVKYCLGLPLSCACLIVDPFCRAFLTAVDYLLQVAMHRLSDLLAQGCQAAQETTVRQPVRK